MKKKLGIAAVPFVIIGIIILIGIYFIISSHIDAKYKPNYTLEDFYVKPNKKVGVNEYTVSSVTDEDMVSTYFHTYTLKMIEDPNGAYALLDDVYRESEVSNINIFKNKVAAITDNFTVVPKINRYELTHRDDYKIYKISDTRGNIYTFKVEGVMKYTVTIE